MKVYNKLVSEIWKQKLVRVVAAVGGGGDVITATKVPRPSHCSKLIRPDSAL